MSRFLPVPAAKPTAHWRLVHTDEVWSAQINVNHKLILSVRSLLFQ